MSFNTPIPLETRAGVADRIEEMSTSATASLTEMPSGGFFLDISKASSRRVGSVLSLAVLIDFADGAGLLQHADRPPSGGPDGLRSSLLSASGLLLPKPNPPEWIHAAIKRAVMKVKSFDLDVRLISCGQPSVQTRELEKELL